MWRTARRGLAAAERDARAERGEAAEQAAAVGINGKVVGAIGGVVHVVCSSNGRLSFDARQRRTACRDAGRDATAGVAHGRGDARCEVDGHKNVTKATITRPATSMKGICRTMRDACVRARLEARAARCGALSARTAPGGAFAVSFMRRNEATMARMHSVCAWLPMPRAGRACGLEQARRAARPAGPMPWTGNSITQDC